MYGERLSLPTDSVGHQSHTYTKGIVSHQITPLDNLNTPALNQVHSPNELETVGAGLLVLGRQRLIIDKVQTR